MKQPHSHAKDCALVRGIPDKLTMSEFTNVDKFQHQHMVGMVGNKGANKFNPAIEASSG